MLFGLRTESDRIIDNIRLSAKTSLSDEDIVKIELNDFLASPERKLMLTGEQYYRNHTDIQHKTRLLSDGQPLRFRANNKLEHAFYRKMVDQLIGYLIAKRPTVGPAKATTDAEKQHARAIEPIFDERFWLTIMAWARGAVNQGIAWLQPYINDKGELRFSYIPGYEVVSLWRDNLHTETDGIIRSYEVDAYEGKIKKRIRKVEVMTENGIKYFVWKQGNDPTMLTGLVADNDMSERDGKHFTLNGKGQVWDRIPMIALRYNDIEQPLIDLLKSNIDAYNKAASVHADILEDIPAALLKVIGYGGNPDNVLHDVMQNRIAMLQIGGDLDIMQSEPQTESVETMLTRMRRDIFSFGAGVDGQDDGQDNKSGVALQEKRSDLDTIANIFETHIQAAFQQLLWFVHQYLAMTGQGDYTTETISLTLNRDIITNESEAITDCKNSVGIISQRTIIERHPWVQDIEQEIEQMDEEAAQEQAKFEETQAAFARTKPGAAAPGAPKPPNIPGATTK